MRASPVRVLFVTIKFDLRAAFPLTGGQESVNSLGIVRRSFYNAAASLRRLWRVSGDQGVVFPAKIRGARSSLCGPAGPGRGPSGDRETARANRARRPNRSYGADNR